MGPWDDLSASISNILYSKLFWTAVRRLAQGFIPICSDSTSGRDFEQIRTNPDNRKLENGKWGRGQTYRAIWGGETYHGVRPPKPVLEVGFSPSPEFSTPFVFLWGNAHQKILVTPAHVSTSWVELFPVTPDSGFRAVDSAEVWLFTPFLNFQSCRGWVVKAPAFEAWATLPNNLVESLDKQSSQRNQSSGCWATKSTGRKELHKKHNLSCQHHESRFEHK